jgi:hypothetical protein
MTLHEEFARATFSEKFTRYQAEAREPRIKRRKDRSPADSEDRRSAGPLSAEGLEEAPNDPVILRLGL